MVFDKLELSEVFKNKIAGHINGGRFPHASVISGSDGDLLFALSRNIARALVCSSMGEKPCNVCTHCKKAFKESHPDIICLQLGKDEREIKVEQVRSLVRDAVILPNEAERKIYIIRNADAMNQSAQNAFLKLLEEPPGYVVFMLLAENPGLLLETVRSRCVMFEMERVRTEAAAEKENSLHSEYLDKLLGSSELAMAEFSLKAEKLNRQEMQKFLSDTYEYLAVQLRLLAVGGKCGEEMNRVKSAIELFKELKTAHEYNVSAGHLAGLLAVKSAEIMFEMRK